MAQTIPVESNSDKKVLYDRVYRAYSYGAIDYLELKKQLEEISQTKEAENAGV